MPGLGDSTVFTRSNRWQCTHRKHIAPVITVPDLKWLSSWLKFVDSLFQRGSLGGAEAGLILRDEIAGKIHQYTAAQNWKIVTKLYVDFESLLDNGKPRTCTETGLRKFFGGFTQVQSAFEAVDTGPGLDEATLKISGE